MLVHSRFGARCRIWHKIFKITMASIGMSIILIGFLSSCPPGARLSRSPAEYHGSSQAEEPSRMPWKHNRALQFMNVDTLNSQDIDSVMDESHQRLQKGSKLSDINLKVGANALKSYSEEGPDSLSTDKLVLNSHQVRKVIFAKGKNQSVRYYSNHSSESEANTSVRNLHFIVESKIRSDVKLNELKNSSYLDKNHLRHGRIWRNSTEIPAKRLPKVLIIGVKKAGTRALLEFLRAHPSIESPGPEPHFFDRNYHRGLHWYRELMPKSYHDQLTVEKTPAYFVSSEVPQRVFDLDPNMKLLLVVRDPVTRAISDYCQAASKHPVKPFERMAMENGIQGQIHANWSAIRIGLYAQHMARWLNVFPPSQFYVVDGQRLVDHPAAELTQVEKFLGISSFIRDSHFRLRSFKGKFPCLVREDGSVHCLNERSKGRAHPVVQENVLHRLRKFYKPHNERFFTMVGRTFDWKS